MKQLLKCFFGFHQWRIVERATLYRRGTRSAVGTYVFKECKCCGSTRSESNYL
jgi:hypothetical protein